MKENKKNVSYEKDIQKLKEKKKLNKTQEIDKIMEKDVVIEEKDDYDFSFLNDEKKEKKKKDKMKEKKEVSILDIKEEKNKKVKRNKNDKIIEFRGEEINITKEKAKQETKEFDIDSSEYKKSKLCILFLIITLLVILGYGYYLYKTLDFKSLEMIDIVKSLSFVLIAFVVILVLFKINTKKTSPYIIFLSLLIIGYSIFSVSYAKDEMLYVSDFINHDYIEVLDWANANKVELITLHEYSDTVPENHVIMQEYGIATPISSINSFKITISDGPNPYKEVTVPNFVGFKFDDVMKFINENHLTNVEIEFTNSDKERDTVIEHIGTGTIKRMDLVKFIFSYGEEIENTPVKDLKGLSLFEATTYLKRYGIIYELEYNFDNKIKKDHVISQDKVNEIVQNIKLVISKGQEIVVPDLTKMSTSEIAKWASSNNIKLKYEEIYNKEYESGKVIKTNVLENDKIQEGSEITITISKGSLVMPEIKDITDFKLWATTNNIPYEENYEFSNNTKSGELINVTPKAGEKITENDTIILTISKGKSVTVPNLIGMSKSEITNKCKNAGVTCTFKYGALTEKTQKDISIGQSKKSGLTVAEGTNVTITLSSGIVEKITIPNFIGKSKSEISSSCSSIGLTCNFNYSNNYSDTNKDIALNQDKTGTVNKWSTVNITLSKGPAKTYNVVIDGSLLSLGNPEQTKNTLKTKLENACPGVTFKFSFKAVNSGIGYLNPDSQVKVGSNTFTEGKTYNIIINSN